MNELLLKKEQKLEAKLQRLEKEKVEMEAKLRANIISVEDVAYTMFDGGFDKAVGKVKHFNSNVLIDFNSVNWEKRLIEILGQ